MHPKINKETLLPIVETDRPRLIIGLFVAVILLVFWPGQRVLASTDSYVQKNDAGISNEYQNYTSAYCLLIVGPGGCSGGDKTEKKALLFVLRWVSTHIQWDPSHLEPFRRLDFYVAKGLECLETLCMTK